MLIGQLFAMSLTDKVNETSRGQYHSTMEWMVLSETRGRSTFTVSRHEIRKIKNSHLTCSHIMIASFESGCH